MPAVAVGRSRRDPVIRELSSPRVNLVKVAFAVVQRPRLVTAVIDGVGSPVTRLRFASAKVLRLVSERAPHLLYPHFDAFLGMLDSGNAILRWDATHIIANLAGVDHQEYIENILDRYMDPITGHEMIGAATCIQGAARIARAKPHLAEAIAGYILKTQHGVYKTPECRDIAIGHAITAFDQFFRELNDSRADVLDFVTLQLHNARPATRKKAEAFLKKWAA